MKKVWLAALAFLGIIALNTALGGNGSIKQATPGDHETNVSDRRISLNLSPKMKQSQISSMREYLYAVQSIIRLMSEDNFEDASKKAYVRLGLTPEKQETYTMFNNKEYTALELASHRSGDELGKALKTGNMKASLRALDKTMGYCTECHATFRQ